MSEICNVSKNRLRSIFKRFYWLNPKTSHFCQSERSSNAVFLPLRAVLIYTYNLLYKYIRICIICVCIWITFNVSKSDIWSILLRVLNTVVCGGWLTSVGLVFGRFQKEIYLIVLGIYVPCEFNSATTSFITTYLRIFQWPTCKVYVTKCLKSNSSAQKFTDEV